MENQLGARIAKLRRACGLTQETLGGQLGVSAAAVSKWETGAACPDVTLLCPLARALHTNVNALLAFEQTMTREQLTAFSEAFVQLVRGGRRQTALEDMERLLAEYPGDTAPPTELRGADERGGSELSGRKRDDQGSLARKTARAV